MKRVSLTNALRQTTAPTDQPAQEPAPAKAQAKAKPKTKSPTTGAKRKASGTTPKSKDKRRDQDWRQVNILLPPELLRNAKIKALRADRPLYDVVAKLVRGWTAGEIDA